MYPVSDSPVPVPVPVPVPKSEPEPATLVTRVTPTMTTDSIITTSGNKPCGQYTPLREKNIRSAKRHQLTGSEASGTQGLVGLTQYLSNLTTTTPGNSSTNYGSRPLPALIPLVAAPRIRKTLDTFAVLKALKCIITPANISDLAPGKQNTVGLLSMLDIKPQDCRKAHPKGELFQCLHQQFNENNVSLPEELAPEQINDKLTQLIQIHKRLKSACQGRIMTDPNCFTRCVNQALELYSLTGAVPADFPHFLAETYTGREHLFDERTQELLQRVIAQGQGQEGVLLSNIGKIEDPLFLQLIASDAFNVPVVLILEDAGSGELIVMNIVNGSDEAPELLEKMAADENQFGKNIAVIRDVSTLVPERISMIREWLSAAKVRLFNKIKKRGESLCTEKVYALTQKTLPTGNNRQESSP